jgi:hypothetical protein
MTSSPKTPEVTPIDLLLGEFIEDTEWHTYRHTPEKLARAVAGTALDAMYGTEVPQYEIDDTSVGNVAGLIAQAEGMADCDAVRARATELFRAGQPNPQLQLVS